MLSRVMPFLLIIFALLQPLSASHAENKNEPIQSLSIKVAALQQDIEQIAVFVENNTITAKDLHERVNTIIQQLEKATINDVTSVGIQNNIELSQQLTQNLQQVQKEHSELSYKISDAQKLVAELNKEISSLRQIAENPLNKEDISTSTHTLATTKEQTETTLAEQSNLMSLIEKKISKTQKKLKLWSADVSKTSLHLEKRKALTSKETQQTQEQKELIQSIAQLHNELRKENRGDNVATIESKQKLLHTQRQHLWLLNANKKLFMIVQNQTFYFNEETWDDLPLSVLEQQYRTIEEAELQLSDLSERVNRQYEQWKKYSAISGTDIEISDKFNQITQSIAYQKLLCDQNLDELSDIINVRKRKNLFSRDKEYSGEGFLEGLKQLPHDMQQMLHQISISITYVINRMKDVSPPISIASLGALIALFGLARWLANHISMTKIAASQDTSVMNKIIIVVHKSRYILTLLGELLAVILMLSLAHPSRAIALTLILAAIAATVWLTLILIDRASPKYVKTSSLLRTLVFIALLSCTVLYCLSVFSGLEKSTMRVYERLFMIALACFVWLERDILTNLAIHIRKTDNHDNVLYRLYRNSFLCIPYFVLVTATLNLIGFSQLSLLVISYTGIGFTYLIAINIGIKAINNLRKFLKLQSLSTFNHGALIASEIVPQITVIMKGLWLFGVTHLLFYVLDWDKNSYAISESIRILRHPIASVGTITISLQILLFSGLAIYGILAVSKWLKSFSYQILYVKVQDLGIRRSLSIFSQYVFMVIGVLIALNLLGIDLTSITVFAGALGVGIGLGIQDIAKNFISGILLLIERPLRDGDWVAIDGNEGTIKTIGMRAITMETFDRQEVIIPNSMAINNSFVNNTHSNTVIRKVHYVGADYNSAPEKVIAVLSAVLSNNENILDTPEPMAVAWEYGDSSINYRVQYYLDTATTGSFSTRTQVIKDIWHAFKENDISMPFPQRDIHIISQE